MERMHFQNPAYCIPHYAIHTGSHQDSVPIDVASLIEEVIREYPIQFPRMRSPLRQDRDAAIGKHRVDDIETGQSAPPDFPPRETNDDHDIGVTSTAENAAAATERESFRRNRTQLFHPPTTRNRTSLHFLAGVLTVAIAGMIIYLCYVHGMLNPFLPAAIEYRRPSLDLQIQRSVSMFEERFERQFPPCA